MGSDDPPAVASLGTSKYDPENNDGKYRSVPIMPLREFICEHRNKQHKDVLFNCMVAAKVSKKDMHASPDAMQALGDE